MPTPPAKPSHRSQRRKHVVDVRAQVGVALRILAPVAAVSLMSGAAVLLFLRRDDTTILHVADLQRFLWIANGIYFVLLVSVLTVASLILTHRWAGPALVIQDALDGMRRGDHTQRLELRRSDYLKGVASRLAALREDLARDRRALDESLCNLEGALADGDTATAARIVAGLRGASAPPAGPSEPARDAVGAGAASGRTAAAP